MAENLFDLAARITADTSQHDRALTESQKKVLALAAEHKALDTKSSAAFKNVGQAAQQLSGHLTGTSHAASELHREFVRTSLSGEGLHLQLVDLVSGAGLLENPLTLAAAAVAALGIAGFETEEKLFELAKQAADYGDEIFKAEQKTGLSASTLSTLKVIATETDTSFESLTTSAARLQVAISRGITEKSSEAAKALQLLKLNTEEFKKASPDHQLSLTAKALEEVTNQADKNRAAQALLSRGWLQSADAIHAIAEEFDGAQKKADQFGLTMSEDDVKAAHEFEVAVKDLWMRFEGFGVKVGGQILPQVQGALNDLTQSLFGMDGALGSNQSAWDQWGTHAAAMVGLVRVAWAGLTAFVVSGGDVMNAVANARLKAGDVANEMGMNDTSGIGASFGLGVTKQRTPGAFPSGGGRKGGGGGDPAQAAKRLADLRLKAVLDELKAEEDANKHALDRQWEDFDQYSTRYTATEERRHAAVIAGLAEEMTAAERIRKSQQRDIAVQEIKNKQTQEEITHEKNRQKLNDERARLLDQMNDFIAQQVREINYARAGTDQYDKSISELEVQLKKAGVTEVEYKIALMRTNAETQRAIDLVKSLTRERRAIAERQRFADPANLAHSVGIELDETGATRDRRALKMPTWLYNILPGGDIDQKLHRLAGDITSTLDNAIRTGFEQGAKEGFRSMALGFLQLLEKMAEDWLASSIFKMLQSAFSPGSGGDSFWGKLLGSIIGGAAGGKITGGTSAAKGALGGLHLAGGMSYVPFDNFPAVLHKGERVMTAAENRQESRGGDLHVHFHVDSVEKAGSRETQRQVADKIRRLQLHSALTG